MEILILLARFSERMGHSRTPIFVYHSIDTSGTPIALSPQIFEQQLNYLRNRRYNILSASQSVEAYRQKQRSYKCVVLTFDDAYMTIKPWIENLLSRGETATIFVPSALMGESNRWDENRGDILQTDIMAPKHLNTLQKNGCEIGTHTHTHPNLTKLSIEKLKQELRQGREELEQQLNNTTDLIAYPYGAYNDLVKRESQQAGYAAGFTTQLGYLNNQSDLLEIPRFPTNIDFQLFRLIVHGGYAWYRKLQDWVFV